MPRDIVIFCHSKNFKKIYPAISEKSCEQKRGKKLDLLQGQQKGTFS